MHRTLFNLSTPICLTLLSLGMAFFPRTLPTCAAQTEHGPTVGVYYFPGWYRTGGDRAKPPFNRDSDWSEWRGAVAKAATPRPLCGFYDDSTPVLWDYYCRWLSTHGIDFLSFDWYYNDGHEYLNESLDRGFLGSGERQRIDYCLHWCNHDGPWWPTPLDQSRARLMEMIDLASRKHFGQPNYLQIDGKPVFMLFDSDILQTFGGFDVAKKNLEAMRVRARENGYAGLYLVGVYSRASAAKVGEFAGLGYDAFCAYSYAWETGPEVHWKARAYPYAGIVNNLTSNVYDFLDRMGRKKGIPYWPTVFSGWDDRPRAGLERGLVLTDNTPEQFGKMFRGALDHINADSPIVIAEAWNEWGEGANIEPSKRHGFGYLSALAAALEDKYPERQLATIPDTRLPSTAEILSWSILNEEELAEARQNELKPWPIKNTVVYDLAESFDVPEAKLPIVFDLGIGGVPKDAFSVGNARILERTAAGLVIESATIDAQINLPPVRVPTKQVERIVVEVEILDALPEQRAGFSVELFWSTGLMPELSPFCAVLLPIPKNGRVVVLTDEIANWGSCGTPITQLRIDPGNKAGQKVRIRRVTLE